MKAARKDFGAANNTPWLAEITVYLADGTLLDLTVYTSFAMHVKTDAFDPEEQLGGGRQNAEPSGVQVAGIGAPLREAEVSVQAPRVAVDAGAQA